MLRCMVACGGNKGVQQASAQLALALSPEAALFSAPEPEHCSRLPRAPASLGRPAAWSVRGWVALAGALPSLPALEGPAAWIWSVRIVREGARRDELWRRRF